MRWLGLFGNSTPSDKYKVLAFRNDLSPIRPAASDLFDTASDAEAAMRARWPDVERGPYFNLTGAGHRVAEAMNQYPLYATSGETDQGAWILIVSGAEEHSAVRAFKAVMRYWASEYRNAQ